MDPVSIGLTLFFAASTSAVIWWLVQAEISLRKLREDLETAHAETSLNLASVNARTEELAERLSRRHASSGNGLLVDARELGSRLADIPGPGAVMPLVEDVFTLPEPTDLDGLSAAIRRLEKSVMLPSATIKISEPVES